MTKKGYEHGDWGDGGVDRNTGKRYAEDFVSDWTPPTWVVMVFLLFALVFGLSMCATTPAHGQTRPPPVAFFWSEQDQLRLVAKVTVASTSCARLGRVFDDRLVAIDLDAAVSSMADKGYSGQEIGTELDRAITTEKRALEAQFPKSGKYEDTVRFFEDYCELLATDPRTGRYLRRPTLAAQ